MKWKKVLSVLLSAAMMMGTVSPGLDVRAAEDAVSNVTDINSNVTKSDVKNVTGSDQEDNRNENPGEGAKEDQTDRYDDAAESAQEGDVNSNQNGDVQDFGYGYTDERSAAKQQDADTEQGKIVYYDFQSYDSTIINDASGNGKAGVVRNYDAGGFQIIDTNIYGKDVKALSLPGGSDGGYLELPVGLLDGEESVTISTWVKLLTDTGYQRIWDLGSGTSSYMYLLSDGANDGFKGYSAAITTGGWSTEKGVSKGSNVDKNRWVLTTVVLDGTQMSLYENGSLVETKDTGISLQDMGHTSRNFIGYGQFGDDPTNAQFAEFEIYNYAMTADQVAGMYDVDDTGIVKGDAAALTLGDLSAVTADLSLPAEGENGSVIEWTSSDPAVITGDGKVVRPAAGQPDAQITLTATIKYQDASTTKEFQAVVPAMLGDEAIVEQDLAAINLVDLDSVVSNLQLPREGKNGSVITWESSRPEVIANDGKVTRPAAGEPDAEVILTASASFQMALGSKVFTATVLAEDEEVTITDYEPVFVTTTVGNVPSLPNTIKVTYSNGKTAKAKTVWNTPDKGDYAKPGKFEVKGKILGTKQVIKAEVTVSEQDDSHIVLQAEAFDLNDITLDGDSILTQNRSRTLAYLKLLDNDRMLYNFRKTFGADTKGAAPLGGWDEPTGLLRGHSTGHYLSALSLAYASTKDAQVKEKLDEMIHELRSLQMLSKGDPAAFETKGTDQKVWNTNPEEWGEGFISAYSPDQFALLEQYTPYATIWAPYYTLHKIIAGFLDAYTYAGNEEALDAAKALGKWVYQRLSACSQEQLTKMWDMYIAGELGGFNESMAKLYELTGDEDYLKGAKLFDNTKFFDNLSKNVDDIQGRHANQHIPQIIGAMEVYQATVQAGKEESYYFHVASNFWDMVTSRYAYSIGGVGTGENFKEPYKQAEYINGDRNCETCAAYNMLKLTKMLYQYDADNAKYMDYYERTLYNQIIASQNPDVTDNMHNGTTYMLPIGPGVRKDYGGDYDSFTCCHGTGMENHVKYQVAAYYQDDTTMYVNLYLPSSVTWQEKGVTVTQDTQFPSEVTTLTVSETQGQTAAAFDMKLRVPYWAEQGFEVTVNGKKQMEQAEPSSYVTLNGIKAGDVIEIRTPYGYHLDKTPDQLSGTDVASLMYGPFVMVAKSDSTKWKTLVLSNVLERSIKKVEEEKVPTLVTNGLTFRPMYDASNYAYHTYFKIMSGEGSGAYYEVTVNNSTPDRGSFEVNSELVKEGGDLIITAKPNDGYKVKKLTVDGKLVTMGEDNTYTVKNVQKNTEITGSFALINPPAQDNSAVEQTATVSAHFTAGWENLNGIKDQKFNPSVSNGGMGKGWGNWPQSKGAQCWVEYEWDAPVTINGSDIFWYDDGGDTRMPGEIKFQYEDENGSVQEAVLTSNPEDGKNIDRYNAFTFTTFTTTRLRLLMTVADNAAAIGIYRWVVTYEDQDQPAVDTGKLSEAIAKAEAMDTKAYTDASAAELKRVIEEVKGLLSKEDITEAQVEEGCKKLADAVNALVLKPVVDKSGLSSAIAKAEKIDTTVYTDASVSELKKVINEVKGLLSKADVTQAQVDEGCKKLENAINKLVLKPVVKPVDKSRLSSLAQTCGKEKQDLYTKASWDTFTKALNSARAILGKANASQQEVDNAFSTLSSSRDKLVKIKIVSTKKITIGKKEKIKLSASGYTFSLKKGKGIVTVNAKGQVLGKKTGKAVVQAVSKSGKMKVWNITVKKAPSKIVKLNKNTVTLKKGKKFTVRATLPKNTASYGFTYKSTNKKIATVNSSGEIKARRKGNCKIWVYTFNGKKKEIQVKVK